MLAPDDDADVDGSEPLELTFAPVKRRDLERHLTAHGARKVTEGGKHTEVAKRR